MPNGDKLRPKNYKRTFTRYLRIHNWYQKRCETYA